MTWWPPIKFTHTSTTTSPPLDAVDNAEILPDYYRFLDPLYSNRKLKPLGDLAPESYRDEEGHVYHSTYRFFPTTIPRNKRLPSEERPAYFQRIWDQVPEPEYRTPSQSLTSGQSSEGREEAPHERTWLLFGRLRNGQVGNEHVNDDGEVGLLVKIVKKLFRFLMVYFGCGSRNEPEASIL